MSNVFTKKEVIQMIDTLSDKERQYFYDRIKKSKRWRSEFRSEWMRSFECDPESLAIRNKIGPSQLDQISGGMILPLMKLHIPEGIDHDCKD